MVGAGGVAGGEPAQLAQQVALGQGRGQLQRPREARRGGNLTEQFLDGGDTDRRQHLAHVLLGMGQVAHGRLPVGGEKDQSCSATNSW